MHNSVVRMNVVALALFAMLLRGMLPAGWMPDTSGAGTGFVICTMEGLRHSAPAPSPSHNDPSKHETSVCPYAAAAHLAWNAIPPTIAAPPQTDLAEDTFSTKAAPLLRVSRSAHAPRAPPSLA